MGKSLDDLFDKLVEFQEKVEQRFDKIEQRFDQIEQRLDQHDLRFEKIEQRLDQIENQLGEHQIRMHQIEERLDQQQVLLHRIEEMTADLIQKVGYTNERFDEIREELHELHSHDQVTNKTLTFLDNKVWEHEKQIFLMREQMATYEKS